MDELILKLLFKSQTLSDYEGSFTNTTGRPTISNFQVEPTNRSLLSCAPFEKLSKEGVVNITSFGFCSFAISHEVITSTTWWLVLIAGGFHSLLFV
ncbi:hypothetical protein V8C34DRAFT_234744 [Trichoderma compactum]